MTNHLKVLQKIKDSMEWVLHGETNERRVTIPKDYDKTLSHTIEVLERLECREGIENIIIQNSEDNGGCGIAINFKKLAQALQDYLKGKK